MAAASESVRIGVSGWRYAPWRGAFYPKGLAQRRELEYASRALPTLEINGSFYSLQRPTSWRRWHDETPPGFVFAVKAPRFITHIKRLRDIEKPLANFFASGVLGLRKKLGPVLWQFPPNFAFDPPTFGAFLAGLPFDTDGARTVAAGHDTRVEGRSWFEPAPSRPLRHAVEVRHPSFADTTFIALLREHRVAFVSADTAGRWLERDDLTTDFAYLRLHGSKTLYQSAYLDAELDLWAERIEAARRGRYGSGARLIAPEVKPPAACREVYCYFDNTDKLEAPRDAARLRERLASR